MKVLLAATPSLTEMELCLKCDHVDQRSVVTPVTVGDYSSELIFVPVISQLCPLAAIIKLWTRNAISTTTLEQVQEFYATYRPFQHLTELSLSERQIDKSVVDYCLSKLLTAERQFTHNIVWDPLP
jgi:hypothetical protein